MLLQIQVQRLIPDYVGVIEFSNILEILLHQWHVLIVKHESFAGVGLVPLDVQAFPDDPARSLTYFPAETIFFIEGVDSSHGLEWRLVVREAAHTFGFIKVGGATRAGA